MQELPGIASGLVREVDPDVAAPDHGRPGLDHRLDHPGGLRVVAIDDVLGPDQARQLVRRPGQGLLVDRALALAELFPRRRPRRGDDCGSAW